VLFSLMDETSFESNTVLERLPNTG